MKIHETKKSFEKSKKKFIGKFSFLVILLNYAFFLPILLIFGIDLQKQIMEIKFDLLYQAVSLDYIIPALVLVISFITIFYYQRFYFKGQIIKQDLKCVFCEKKAIFELYKIPNFFIIFGLPICEQHAKLLDENPNELLYNEQKLYKKTNTIILWLNILIIASGIISLHYFGLIFGLNGNIPIITLIYVLFTIQIVLYLYLIVRMFIKIRNGILLKYK